MEIKPNTTGVPLIMFWNVLYNRNMKRNALAINRKYNYIVLYIDIYLIFNHAISQLHQQPSPRTNRAWLYLLKLELGLSDVACTWFNLFNKENIRLKHYSITYLSITFNCSLMLSTWALLRSCDNLQDSWLIML